MTLTELIQRERIKVATKQGEERANLKEIRRVVRILSQKGFSLDEIIETFNYKKEEIDKVVLSFEVEKLLEEGVETEEIITKLEVSEEFVLLIKKVIEIEKRDK